MGDAADAMIDGLLCSQCGELLDGEETGHPRLCAACDDRAGPLEEWNEHQQRKMPARARIA
jgi:hypothetical protein